MGEKFDHNFLQIGEDIGNYSDIDFEYCTKNKTKNNINSHDFCENSSEKYFNKKDYQVLTKSYLPNTYKIKSSCTKPTHSTNKKIKIPNKISKLTKQDNFIDRKIRHPSHLRNHFHPHHHASLPPSPQQFKHKKKNLNIKHLPQSIPRNLPDRPAPELRLPSLNFLPEEIRKEIKSSCNQFYKKKKFLDFILNYNHGENKFKPSQKQILYLEKYNEYFPNISNDMDPKKLAKTESKPTFQPIQ